MSEPPKFPLQFTDEEGVLHSVGGVSELEETVEYVDDFDPPYHCVDRDGRRVRILMWDLQLLALQVIPHDFDGSMTQIIDTVRGDGIKLWVEVFRGEPLRIVGEAADGRMFAEPTRWQSDVRHVDVRGEVSTVGREEFHDMWMRVRGFRR
jgi:hypothetical protein